MLESKATPLLHMDPPCQKVLIECDTRIIRTRLPCRMATLVVGKAGPRCAGDGLRRIRLPVRQQETKGANPAALGDGAVIAFKASSTQSINQINICKKNKETFLSPHVDLSIACRRNK